MALSLGELTVELTASKQAFDKAFSGSLDTIKQFGAHVSREVTDAQQAAKRFVDTVGHDFRAAGMAMTAGITAPLMAVGVIAAKSAMEFNESMANVASLIPGATEKVERLKSSILDLSQQTGKNAGELTNATYQIISAFGNTSDITDRLRISIEAAGAGAATTREAVNLLSAVTKGYGDASLEAMRSTSDLATLTVRLGQTTFPELAASIGRVVPLASTLKVSQEELFAVMATGSGVLGGAAEVATGFRGILQALMAPTETMNNLIHHWGYNSGAAAIEAEGFGSVLQRIIGVTNDGLVPLQDLVGSIEGQSVALGLAGNLSQQYTQNLDEMSKASGATAAAYKEQTQGVNVAGQAWKEFSASINTVLIRLGDAFAPAFASLLHAMDPVFDALGEVAARIGEAFKGEGVKSALSGMDEIFANLAGKIKSLGGLFADPEFGRKMGSAVESLVTVMRTLVGTISIVISWMSRLDPSTVATVAAVVALSAALGPVLLVISGFAALLSALLSPVGLVIVAVGALTAAWMLWGDDVRKWNGEVLADIQNLVNTVIGWFGDMKNSVVESVKNMVNDALNWFGNFYQGAIDKVKGLTSSVTGFFGDMWDKLTRHSIIPDMVKQALSWFSRMYTGTKEVLDSARQAMKEVQADAAVFQGAMEIATTAATAAFGLADITFKPGTGSPILDQLQAKADSATKKIKGTVDAFQTLTALGFKNLQWETTPIQVAIEPIWLSHNILAPAIAEGLGDLREAYKPITIDVPTEKAAAFVNALIKQVERMTAKISADLSEAFDTSGIEAQWKSFAERLGQTLEDTLKEAIVSNFMANVIMPRVVAPYIESVNAAMKQLSAGQGAEARATLANAAQAVKDQLPEIRALFEAVAAILQTGTPVEKPALITGVAAPMQEAASNLWADIKQVINPMTVFASVIERLNPATEFMATLMEKLAPTIGVLLEPILMVAEALGTALQPVLKAMFPIFQGVAMAAAWLSATILQVAKGLVDLAYQIFFYLPGFKGVEAWLQQLSASLGTAASQMYDASAAVASITWEEAESKAKLREETDRATAAMRNVPAGFKIAWARWASAGADLTLPHFATGGRMQDDGLAWIRRNEVVLPPEQAGRRSGGSLVININNPIYNGDRDMERKMKLTAMQAFKEMRNSQFATGAV